MKKIYLLTLIAGLAGGPAINAAALTPPDPEQAPAAQDMPAASARRKAGKAIYGTDDRKEYYQTSRENRQLADSVVSLWEYWSTRDEGKSVKLFINMFGSMDNLCPSEPFYYQPVGHGFICSGVLVGDDIVLTAGHCIENDKACAEARFVFGFAVKDAGVETATTVPAGEVYSCKRIIKREFSNPVLNVAISLVQRELQAEPDYALLQLNRKVLGHKPLAISRGLQPVKDEDVFVIGHPYGLPLKIAGNAKIRNADHANFFTTDLDAFHGNSGSPVFNAKTRLIEGIISRGETDLVKTSDGCMKANRLAQNSGYGVSVIKVSVFENYIPPLKASPAKNYEFQGVKVPDVRPDEDAIDRLNPKFE